MNGSSSWKTLKIDFPGAVSRGTHAQVSLSLSLSLSRLHRFSPDSPRIPCSELESAVHSESEEKEEKSGSTKFREFGIGPAPYALPNSRRKRGGRILFSPIPRHFGEIWGTEREARILLLSNRSRNSGERVKSVKPEKTETFSTLKVSG